jgi:transcriptional pleiotropic repressor
LATLLERTRHINRFIQASAGHPVGFQEIADVLRRSVDSNVYLAGRNGKILGSSCCEQIECEIVVDQIRRGGQFPEEFNDAVQAITSTSANLQLVDGKCFLDSTVRCPLELCCFTVVPVMGAGDRLGTLVLEGFGRGFDDDDLILAEYASTLIGMRIYRSRSEKIEEETRKRAAVQMAIDTLSYSEQEAVEHIFDELNGLEGLLVASKIADRVGITRSVIVNALRKFESAGVIESRSLGMKGTYIRVLNDKLFDELERLRAR